MHNKLIKILLTDDDTDDCKFFEDALKALPIVTELKTLEDGEQLMNYLLENLNNLPDVVFIDINMPRKNGLDCLTEIKQNNKLKDLPVVILSTSNSEEKKNLVFKLGGHVYIHKPSDFGQLKQIILHALPIALENVFSKGQVKYILNA